MHKITLHNITKMRHTLQWVKNLYYNSFPIEERRPWHSIEQLLLTRSNVYSFNIITNNDQPIGLITMWTFDSFYYIEHFAIDPDIRGNGFGAATLKQLILETNCPIVLEVELPSNGDIACRRIDFYHRNGFTAHYDFDYTQPPYSKDMPPVPLMLMSANAPTLLDLNHITATLYKEVYKVTSPF